MNNRINSPSCSERSNSDINYFSAFMVLVALVAAFTFVKTMTMKVPVLEQTHQYQIQR